MSVILTKPSAPYADQTQAMANGFPDWHAIRRQRGSLGAAILNSAGGKPCSILSNIEVTNFANQTHLSLASIHSNYKAFTVDTRHSPINPKVINYLRNSNFTEWTNPTRMPDYWNVKVEDWMDQFFTVQANASTNFRGGNCLSLQSNTEPYFPFGAVEVYQDYALESLDSSSKWTAIMYFNPFGTEPIQADTIFFFVRLTYEDGTTKYMDTPFYQVEDWTRLMVTIKGDEKISTIRVGVKWEPLIQTPLFGALIDNFMLYKGDENVFWNRSYDDKPSFVTAIQDEFTVMSVSNDDNRSYVLTEINTSEITKKLLPSNAVIGRNFKIPEIAQPDIVTEPISIDPAVWFDGSEWQQSVIVATEAVRQMYRWPTWTLNRIVKFNSTDPEEIFASYLPAFSIANPAADEIGLVTATDNIAISAMTIHNGLIWAIGRITPGAGLNHVAGYLSLLMVFDSVFPKQVDTFDDQGPDYENTPMYLEAKKAYLLNISSGLGYGDLPYADDGFGGDSNPLRLECQHLEFIENDKIAIKMALGYEGIIHMKYDYFARVNGNAEIVVLRNYVVDDPGANIIVC